MNNFIKCIIMNFNFIINKYKTILKIQSNLALTYFFGIKNINQLIYLLNYNTNNF